MEQSVIDQARATPIEIGVHPVGLGLKRVGHQWVGPCPICGAGDDRFSINTAKQQWFARKCDHGAHGGDVIGLIQYLYGCDFREAVERLAGRSPSTGTTRRVEQHEVKQEQYEDAKRKAEIARWLWQRRQKITDDCPAGRYLRYRGYTGPIPETLGYLPPNGDHAPAMIAAFGFCDEPEPGLLAPPDSVESVHITRLTADGHKADTEPVKIILGQSMGLPIVLAPANDGLAIDITEGIEDGLSVLGARGCGVWVAGAACRMPDIAESLPDYVEAFTIFADPDVDGLRYAKEAGRLIKARAIDVHIKLVADVADLKKGGQS